MVLTAIEKSALEPTDQWMDLMELHAPESNQMISLIITPTQPPEDHIKPLVTLPQPPQSSPLPTHGQLLRTSPKREKSTVSFKSWMMQSHPQRPRRFPFSRPHMVTPTPPSTDHGC